MDTTSCRWKLYDQKEWCSATRKFALLARRVDKSRHRSSQLLTQERLRWALASSSSAAPSSAGRSCQDRVGQPATTMLPMDATRCDHPGTIEGSVKKGASAPPFSITPLHYRRRRSCLYGHQQNVIRSKQSSGCWSCDPSTRLRLPQPCIDDRPGAATLLAQAAARLLPGTAPGRCIARIQINCYDGAKDTLRLGWPPKQSTLHGMASLLAAVQSGQPSVCAVRKRRASTAIETGQRVA